jgi:hypothetical protein
MNGKLFDLLDTEDYDIYGEENDYESIYDDESAGEDYGDWEASDHRQTSYQQRLQTARRMRELQRRQALAQARARNARLRRQPVSPAQPAARVNQGLQRAQAGIEKVDLENKVQTDLFSGALRAQRDRISRNEYALAASTLTDQLKQTFPNLFEGDLGTLLPFASLLLLKPDDRGKTGFDRYITDPRIIFPALALGLKLFRDQSSKGQQITIFPDKADLSLTNKEPILLSVRDQKGQPVAPNLVSWNSQNKNIADVDASGLVTPTSGVGYVTIVATFTQNKVSVSNLALVHVVK